MILFVDIETIPNWEREVLELPSKPTKDDVALGNTKDPTKVEALINQKLPVLIDKWKQECESIKAKEEELYRKQALVSYKCRVICVSFCVVGKEHVVGEVPIGINHFIGEEQDIIQNLAATLLPLIRHEVRVVGQNTWFDLSIIRQRAAKYGVITLKAIIPTYKYDKRIIDISSLFTQNEKYVSMDDMCKFFGLEGKGEVDGSKVFDLWKAGEIETIAEYCDEDVERTMKIYDLLCNEDIGL